MLTNHQSSLRSSTSASLAKAERLDRLRVRWNEHAIWLVEHTGGRHKPAAAAAAAFWQAGAPTGRAPAVGQAHSLRDSGNSLTWSATSKCRRPIANLPHEEA